MGAGRTTAVPQCLTVWRGAASEGTPLVWSDCRTDRFAHQQWRRVPSAAAAAKSVLSAAPVPPLNGSFLLEHGGGADRNGSKDEPLCVAVPLPTRLLLS
jgi:hypothetical protein